MQNLIFSHIEGLPDIIISVSYNEDYSNFHACISNREKCEITKMAKDIHIETSKDILNNLKSKKGICFNPSDQIQLKLKGLFFKKLVLEYNRKTYKSFKI